MLSDHFEGITLQDGSKIERSIYLKLSITVREFLKESRGYLKQIETCRDLEKVNPHDFMLGRIDNLPGSYLSSLKNLISEMERIKKKLDPQALSLREVQYVVQHLNQIKEKIPELSVINIFQDLYKRFEKFGVR